jgi:hypothetical protein
VRSRETPESDVAAKSFVYDLLEQERYPPAGTNFGIEGGRVRVKNVAITACPHDDCHVMHLYGA